MVWDLEQHEARVTRGQLVDLWERRNVFNVVKLFNFKINKPGTNFTKQKSIYKPSYFWHFLEYWNT